MTQLHHTHKHTQRLRHTPSSGKQIQMYLRLHCSWQSISAKIFIVFLFLAQFWQTQLSHAETITTTTTIYEYISVFSSLFLCLKCLLRNLLSYFRARDTRYKQMRRGQQEVCALFRYHSSSFIIKQARKKVNLLISQDIVLSVRPFILYIVFFCLYEHF